MFLKILSPAKINLFLHITAKRPDGYHDLITLMCCIGLFDTITLTFGLPEISVTCDHPQVPEDESNLAWRAADLFLKKLNRSEGLKIALKKQIPVAAGLGGGSSNAAVVLLFLNNDFGLNMTQAEMVKLASQIGAVIPFFLMGGTVLGEGIGEKLTPVEELDSQPISIVFPSQKVPTRQIFSHFSLTSKAFESKISIFLKKRDLSILENDLEKTTFSLFPKIQQIKEEMKTMNFDLVLMSGSGSALFGLGRNADSDRLRQTCKAEVTVTETLNRDSYTSGIGVWPSGKASVFGADTRRFESSHPRE